MTPSDIKIELMIANFPEYLEKLTHKFQVTHEELIKYVGRLTENVTKVYEILRANSENELEKKYFHKGNTTIH